MNNCSNVNWIISLSQENVNRLFDYFCGIAAGQDWKNLVPVFGGEMATAKIRTVKGFRVEIFSRPVRKNTTRPLTVWIGGTEIKRRLFSAGKYAILVINKPEFR